MCVGGGWSVQGVCGWAVCGVCVCVHACVRACVCEHVYGMYVHVWVPSDGCGSVYTYYMCSDN